MSSSQFKARFKDKLYLVPRGGELSINDSKPILKIPLPLEKFHDNSPKTLATSLSQNNIKAWKELHETVSARNGMKKISEPPLEFLPSVDLSPIYTAKKKMTESQISLPSIRKSYNFSYKKSKRIENSVKFFTIFENIVKCNRK